MSGRPPEEDQHLSAILAQVGDALDESGIVGAELREALLQGVRVALGGEGEPAPPEITLVQGGRQEGEPTSVGERPELRVADAEERGAGVKVFVTSGLRSRVEPGEPGTARPQGVGRLRLEGSPETPDTQTVFRGAEPRAYRLHCDRGELRVALEGQPADRVGDGRSLDVEARLIRVSATGAAAGWYLRLGAGGPGE